MKAKVSMSELEAIVRNRICAACTGRTVEGLCGADDPKSCTVFRLFPLVAEAILATESEELEPYLQAIEENVCSVCIDQTMDGTCSRRGGDCTLSRHLPQVIEAIEEATGRSFPRGALTSDPPRIGG